MKKTFFLFLTSVLLAVQLDAQADKKIRFGIKAGLNHSVINGYETNGTKTGYIGTEVYSSLFADVVIAATTYFETELLFSFTDDAHFIEVPFHIKQQLSKRFNLFLGPKLDFSIDNQTQKYWNDFKRVGISVDAGCQFAFLKRFFVEARYSKGLTKQIYDTFFDINDGKRNTFRIGAGIRF